jgi:hypothetical protein
MDITFDRPLGAVIRQTHHWAALVFVAALVLHAGRVFFTGAFRRPRRLNWLVGLTLMGLAMANRLLRAGAAPRPPRRHRFAHRARVRRVDPGHRAGRRRPALRRRVRQPRMLHRFWLLHVSCCRC